MEFYGQKRVQSMTRLLQSVDAGELDAYVEAG
jgi:hypothetical protein